MSTVGAVYRNGSGYAYQHAIEGYTGNAGIMPIKGGRIDLSDEQVIASAKFMVEHSQ